MSQIRPRQSVSSAFAELSQPLLSARSSALHDKFHTAISAADLASLITEIDAETSRADTQLRHLVEAAQRKHTQQISGVELSRAKLSSAITSSHGLTGVFSAANDLGRSLTAKIKALDREIERVDRTLVFVSDTQTLKNSISQIQYAIEKSQWQEAAQCIYAVRNQLTPGLEETRFAAAVVPSSKMPELPKAAIDAWAAQLCDTFVALFSEAAQKRDVAAISAYFQLFPLIGRAETGLNCYSKFICGVVTDTSRTLLQAAARGENKAGVHASATASLFESISVMLSQHTPLITKHYAGAFPGAVAHVVTRIQHEIDAQIATIADTFYDCHRIDKTMQDIRLHRFSALKRRLAEGPVPAESAQGGDIDADVTPIVEIGDVMNELSAILHHWSLYCRFLAAKYFPESGNSGNSANPELPALLAASTFERKVREKYLPAFECLCAFYFRRSLEKAVTIEEIPPLEPFLAAAQRRVSPEQPPVSSVVEDVTLVFNSTFRSVLDAAQVSAVRKFATETLTVMQNDLLNGVFQQCLTENQPRYNNTLAVIEEKPAGTAVTTPSITRAGTPAPDSVGGFFKGASSAFGNVVGTGSAIVSAANPAAAAAANNPRLMSFIVYLNTVAVGQDFFRQIVQNVTVKNPGYLKGNFPFGRDEEIVQHVIQTELLEPFAAATGQIIKNSLHVLLNQSIKNRLAALVAECFPDAGEENYMVYSAAKLNDPATISKFKRDWDDLVQPYRQTLHKALLYDRLLRLIVVNIANMIEKRLVAVLKKFKINELGALKLDKDLSFIINEVCDDDYELREKFLRVTQLVLLVGMDNEEYEMSAYRGDADDESGINWVLTPLERKQIRRFRY